MCSARRRCQHNFTYVENPRKIMAGSRSGHRVASVVLGCVILALGIAVCVIIDQIIRLAIDSAVSSLSSDDTLHFDSSSFTDSDIEGTVYQYIGWIWIFGLLYVVPGITGIISGATGKSAAYVIHMIMEICALVIAGIILIFSFAVGIGAIHMQSRPDCTTVGDICQCGTPGFNPVTFKSCDQMHSLVMLGQSFTALFIIGWILSLADVIHSGVSACRKNETPGFIVTQQQVPCQVVMVHPNMGMQVRTDTGQILTTSDTAKLVNHTY